MPGAPTPAPTNPAPVSGSTVKDKLKSLLAGFKEELEKILSEVK